MVPTGVIKEENIITHSGWRLSVDGPLGDELYYTFPELDPESAMEYYMPSGPVFAGKNLGEFRALCISIVGRYGENAGDYNNMVNDIAILSDATCSIVS